MGEDKKARSSAGRLFQGAAIVLVVHGIGSLLKYLSQIFLARWLGPDGFGSYTFAYSWTQLLAPLAALGLATGVLRFVPEYLVHEMWPRIRGLLQRSSQLTLVAGVILAAAGTLVAAIFRLPVDRVTLVLALWLIPVLALSQLQMQFLRATEDMLWAYGTSQVLFPILHLAGAYIFLHSIGLDSTAALVAALLSLFVVLIVQRIGLRAVLPLAVFRGPPQFDTRKWLMVSMPLLVVALGTTIQSRSDVVLVGLFRGSTSAGLYSAAVSSANMIKFLLVAVNGIAAPMISRLFAQGRVDELQRIVTWVTLVLGALAMIIGMLFVVVGRTLLGVFGEAFPSAYPILVVLTLSEVINVAAGPVGYIMNLTGFEKDSARVFATATVVNVALTLILIPLVGPIGAAYATLGSMLLWNAWLSFLIHRNLGLHTFFFIPRQLFGSVGDSDG